MSRQIAVLTGAAAVPSVELAAAEFKKRTGVAVTVTANLHENVSQRVIDGEMYDLVLSSSSSLDKNYRPFGLIEDGGINVAQSGIGVAIRPGAPSPGVGSLDAFKRALLEADALLYTKHTTGYYIEDMLKRIGLSERLVAKSLRFPNGPDLMDRVLAGSGREFGMLSISQIRLYKDRGLILVGPLPEEIQHYSYFTAVPTARSVNKEIAWEFARFCGDAGRSYFNSM